MNENQQKPNNLQQKKEKQLGSGCWMHQTQQPALLKEQMIKLRRLETHPRTKKYKISIMSSTDKFNIRLEKAEETTLEDR